MNSGSIKQIHCFILKVIPNNKAKHKKIALAESAFLPKKAQTECFFAIPVIVQDLARVFTLNVWQSGAKGR